MPSLIRSPSSPRPLVGASLYRLHIAAAATRSLRLIELQNTWVWLGVLAVLLIVLLLLATSFDYPLLACWPAFSSAILLVTCGVMLYQGIPNAGIVPITRSPLELWGVGVLAGVALIWVVLSTRRLKENI
jgi:hypothetical protein